ncbi:MAG: cobalt-precorrin 5A hydrolase [Lachnospiraceae bacterium]|nr:cobalt-precorrin 5A hydrolase [Lachnospiraceae bacterium]
MEDISAKAFSGKELSVKTFSENDSSERAFSARKPRIRVSCISFTANGSHINRRLLDWFLEQGADCDSQALARYAETTGVSPLKGSFKDWCREKFQSSDVLIFIGAAGIAVRGIAPWVRDKKTDPAVLVIDEQGNFVISLLSGHIGGANEMTRQVAQVLGAAAVITTGTDVNHTFAVDAFAAKNQLQIEDMQLAKKIAAALIDREAVGFFSELPAENKVPEVLVTDKTLPVKYAVRVTVHHLDENPSVLRLIPKNIHLGIGCRRDTPFEIIERKVCQAMEACGLDWKAVADASSIDLKKNEAGLLKFCQVHNLPFHVYSAQELQAVEGEFTPSRFVGSITGVDNVCERSAALSCIRRQNNTGTYRMIQKKLAGDGVTAAIAMEDWSIRFE